MPAYAATIHKSQGSEYPAVVIPVMTQHYTMLQRNLLYTGVTRGKRLVVLVGQKKAVAIAVRNISGRRRWSKLAEWLRLGQPVARESGMKGRAMVAGNLRLVGGLADVCFAAHSGLRADIGPCPKSAPKTDIPALC